MIWLLKPRIAGFVRILSSACITACAFAASLPTASQVFDRYVRVTGGEKAWHSKISERDEIEARALDTGQVILRATTVHTRSGNALHNVTIPEKAQEGVYNGIAWAWTPLSGPRVKHGADRDEAIRLARMLEEGDWRKFYPNARVAGVEDIDGAPCYRVALADSDADWFEISTGLLKRRLSEGAISTVENWAERDDLKQPAGWLVQREDLTYRLSYLNVTYNDAKKAEEFRLPPQVETYAASERAGTALPNAEEIIERHILESGGAEAYAHLKTQKVTGTLNFITRNVEARTESWSGGGGRYYQLVDIPGLGAEEQGSDGRIAWERSSVLGPRLHSKKSSNTLGLTLDAAAVVGWRYLVGEVRTEAEETIDGHDCYRVKLVGRDASQSAIRWYDRRTGLLYRASMQFKTEMGMVPAVMTYEAYKRVEGIQWPVRIHMMVSGQELLFNASEVALNNPVDDAIFEVPEEVKNIADSQDQR